MIAAPRRGPDPAQGSLPVGTRRARTATALVLVRVQQDIPGRRRATATATVTTDNARIMITVSLREPFPGLRMCWIRPWVRATILRGQARPRPLCRLTLSVSGPSHWLARHRLRLSVRTRMRTRWYSRDCARAGRAWRETSVKPSLARRRARGAVPCEEEHPHRRQAALTRMCMCSARREHAEEEVRRICAGVSG